MNVLNPETVDAFCHALSSRAASPMLAQWLRRNLRKHVLRTPELHLPTDRRAIGELVVGGLLPEPPPWLDEAFERGDAVHRFDPEAEAVVALVRDIDTVIDHRNAEMPDAMDRVSVPEAIAAAHLWERQESRARLLAFADANGIPERQAAALLARRDQGIASLWPEDPAHIRALHSVGPYELVEIVAPAGLDREGMLMDHCVATYKSSLSSGSTRILSLRDMTGIPVTTLEVRRMANNCHDSQRIVLSFLPPGLSVATQIRGPSNGRPRPDQLARLSAALSALGIKVTETERLSAGMPTHLSVASAIDYLGLARALPELIVAEGEAARRRPSPALVHAIREVRRRPDIAAAIDQAAIMSALAPKRGDLSASTTLAVERPATNETVWKIPNLLLSQYLTGEMPMPESARDALVEIGADVIAGIRRSSTDFHKVVPEIGSWKDPLPFFAWCGLGSDWIALQETMRTARTRHLSEERHKAKQRLRAPGVTDDERTTLMNVVNVQIPRLMGM